MSGPVVAATLTRIAAFSPLLFWPGIVGQFMRYMPITLIATLSASLVAALIFTPTLGALIGKPHVVHHDTRARATAPICETVRLAIRHPWLTILLAIALLIGVPIALCAHARQGRRVLPRMSSRTPAWCSSTRAAISRSPRRTALVRSVEARVLDMPELVDGLRPLRRHGPGLRRTSPRTSSARSSSSSSTGRSGGRPARSWTRSATKTADIPGIKVEVTAPQAGPPTGKPIQIQLSSDYPRRAHAGRARDRRRNSPSDPEIRDLDNGLPMPGIDWRLEIDKAEAAKYGIGVGRGRLAVQLVTNGMKITDYRPQTSDKPVDIIVRVPEDRRTLNQIDDLQVQTPTGSVPIGNFIKRVPAHARRLIHRVDGKRVVTVTANVAEGVHDRRRCSSGSPPSSPRRTSAAWSAGSSRARTRSSDEARRVPRQGLRRRHLPDLRGAARAVQQAVERRADALGDHPVDDRRLPRADGHGPGASAS